MTHASWLVAAATQNTDAPAIRTDGRFLRRPGAVGTGTGR